MSYNVSEDIKIKKELFRILWKNRMKEILFFLFKVLWI